MPPNRRSSITRAPRPALDEVNDASFDSFPASDAPTWSSMHAGAPKLSLLSPQDERTATRDDAAP